MNWLLKLLPRDKHLFALLVLTVLINVPFLSPRLIFIHDTLSSFFRFHFAYSDVCLHNEFPRWLPYEGYGIPFDLGILADIAPTGYVAIALGWLTGMKDVLLLYKISFIFSQALFMFGLYLLSNTLYQSKVSTWMVCVGGLLTNSWLTNSLLNFTIFYLLPLVLYLLLRFVESERPVYLWSAAIVELASLLGTLPYIAPVHLLILTTFLVPFFWCKPRLFAVFLSWRTYAQPLFPVLLCFLCLIVALVVGMERTILDVNRDAATGRISLLKFLDPTRPRLGALLAALLNGHLVHGDMTIYVGLLPLAGLTYAWARSRSVQFLAFAGVALMLLGLSLGGWFSRATYYCVPYMNRYTQIWLAFNILKVFWLMLGGFGIDRLLSDLRQQGAMELAAPQWPRLTILLIVPLCCVVDFAGVYYRRRDELSIFRLQRLQSDYSYCDQWFAQYMLMGRFILYALAFAVVGIVLPMFNRWPKSTRARVAGLLLLTVYAADVGLYYSLVIKQAPFYSPHAIQSDATAVPKIHPTLGLSPNSETPEIGDSFWVHGLDYEPRRPYLSPLPERARNIFHIATYQRGNIPVGGTAVYATLYTMMGIDPLVPVEKLNTVMPGVKHMIEARGGSIGEGDGPAFVLPAGDQAFWDSLGYRLDKIRIVREADYVDDERQAIDKFKGEPSPQSRLVIIGPGRPPPESKATQALDNPVQEFTANRMVLKFTADAPGWLFVADAYHPGWSASVNDKPVKVYCANVGCKAVYVETGLNTVVFEFSNGVRGWVCRGVVLFASICGFAMLGYLVVTLWSSSRGAGGPPARTGEPPVPRRTIRIWAICQATFMMVCGLAWYPGLGPIALVAVALATLAGLLMLSNKLR